MSWGHIYNIIHCGYGSGTYMPVLRSSMSGVSPPDTYGRDIYSSERTFAAKMPPVTRSHTAAMLQRFTNPTPPCLSLVPPLQFDAERCSAMLPLRPTVPTTMHSTHIKHEPTLEVSI